MRPRAPFFEMAAGLNPDSISMTDLTSFGSRSFWRAAASINASYAEGWRTRAASHESLAPRFAGPSLRIRVRPSLTVTCTCAGNAAAAKKVPARRIARAFMEMEPRL